MTSDAATLGAVRPSATPTEADIRAWDALFPCYDSLRRPRAVLGHADRATASTATMSEVLAEARARAHERRRGGVAAFASSQR